MTIKERVVVKAYKAFCHYLSKNHIPHIETEFGVIAHNIGSKHIYHHTAEQLFNTYNELNSMDVFDI